MKSYIISSQLYQLFKLFNCTRTTEAKLFSCPPSIYILGDNWQRRTGQLKTGSCLRS